MLRHPPHPISVLRLSKPPPSSMMPRWIRTQDRTCLPWLTQWLNPRPRTAWMLSLITFCGVCTVNSSLIGCGITDPEVKEHFKTRTKLLHDLVREANKNLHEDKSGLWLASDELEGVPSRFIDRLIKGDGEHQGKLWLPAKVPQSSPILAHAKLEATRKRVYYIIQNRMPANVDLFRQIVLLRDETARMLGYDNHACLRIADKMMKIPAQVNELLEQLREKVVPQRCQAGRGNAAAQEEGICRKRRQDG